MSTEPDPNRSCERWARFRFSVVGRLLAAPPAPGELHHQLHSLATQRWRHPISGEWVCFGVSTLERWYYIARNQKQDPVSALQRKLRSDCGQYPSLSPQVREHLALQYRQHPAWSYQLHADNLAVLVRGHADWGPVPGYGAVRRYMQAHGLCKRPRRGPPQSPGAQAAEARYENREIRSYQSEYVHALWHLDFHHGSCRVLLPNGQWARPLLLGILDDRSRLGCHAQWYLAESTADLCHGLCQAMEKRGLPRALMTDNGSAMIAAETVQGLARLGIVHETTLAYSPYQNGKQESFWGQIEGRLLPMLEGVADLTLAQLNEATLAWLEIEYHRKVHSELGQTPLRVFLDTRDVGRPSPSAQQLQQAFTAEVLRTQRRSDGSLSLAGRRFEVPSRYRHLRRLNLRYASWDLSQVHLIDPQTGALLCRLYPQDKLRNANGERAPKTPLTDPPSAPPPSGVAPLLAQILKDYAATGLPPAYMPKNDAPATPHNPT